MKDIKGFKWYSIILSVLIIGLEFFAYTYIGKLDAYILFLFILCKTLLIVLIFIGVVASVTTKKKDLIPTLAVGVISIAIVSSHLVEHLFKEEKKPVYLTQYCNQSIHPLSLKLKDDKTFEYYTGSFLEKETYHGSYLFDCDSLKLVFDEVVPDEFKYELQIKQEEMVKIGNEVKKSQIHHISSDSKTKKSKL